MGDNFTTGQSHSFGGGYLELVPHERIRCADKFDDPKETKGSGADPGLTDTSNGGRIAPIQDGKPNPPRRWPVSSVNSRG